MPHWFEDDRFWAGTYSINFPVERFVSAQREIDQILRQLGGRPRRALDLCCGPGRHAVALAQRGLEVTAVDISKYLLYIGIQLARSLNLPVHYVQADARYYENTGFFDIAIILFNSFGYYTDQEENMAMLQRTFKNLAPDGWLVLDVVARECLSGARLAWFERQENGIIVRRERQMVESNSRVVHRLELHGTSHSEVFDCSYRIYSIQEIVRLLMQVGFQDLKMSGDFDGRPYSEQAEKLVVFARKPVRQGGDRKSF